MHILIGDYDSHVEEETDHKLVDINNGNKFLLDQVLRKEWGFKQNYNLERMTRIMLKEIRNKLK